MSDASNGRLMKLGLLEQRRQELEEARLRFKAAAGALSMSLFLHDPLSPWELDGAAIESHAKEVNRILAEGNKIESQIEDLKAELGIQ